MDDTRRDAQDESADGRRLGRRAFFARALLVTGAAATVLTLSGCPGGEQDDDGGDEGDDD